jgi:hypothetical protein
MGPPFLLEPADPSIFLIALSPYHHLGSTVLEGAYSPECVEG